MNNDDITLHEKAYKVEGDTCFVYMDAPADFSMDKYNETYAYIHFKGVDFPRRKMVMVVNDKEYGLYTNFWGDSILYTNDTIFGRGEIKVALLLKKTFGSSSTDYWTASNNRVILSDDYVPKFPPRDLGEEQEQKIYGKVRIKGEDRDIVDILIGTNKGVKTVKSVVIGTSEGNKVI